MNLLTTVTKYEICDVLMGRIIFVKITNVFSSRHFYRAVTKPDSSLSCSQKAFTRPLLRQLNVSTVPHMLCVSYAPVQRTELFQQLTITLDANSATIYLVLYFNLLVLVLYIYRSFP